eukprot:gnl/MRDRNA2_/MRDRNA2_152078_c0_seq1.p1 gnl/MRDRNA2_/MRDRNA2_152078_c0~~gnl/MRDRNA2_/MRDRNA2_152078_c0_seq1.p1  ORF type:complete len:226 (-),score=57.75 gnl/MRDRNA2_/MRDRNA2_152078_c0_seq1:221-898(-)
MVAFILKRSGDESFGESSTAKKTNNGLQRPKREVIAVEDKDKYVLSEKGRLQMQELQLKVSLNVMQRMHTLEGLNMDCVIAAKSNAAVKASKVASADFSKLTQENEIDLGSPLGYVYVPFLDSFVKQDILKLNKEVLTTHRNSIDEMAERDDLLDVITHFMVKDTYNQDMVKISFVCVDRDVRLALVNGLEQLGGIHKRGRAPRGHLEDELAKWLSAVQKEIENA